MSGFGDRLRDARKQAGLTLEALAERTGSTKAYMWQLENKDAAKVSGELLLKLCEALSMSPATLLGQSINIAVDEMEKEVLFRKYGALDQRDRQTIMALMRTLSERNETSGGSE